MAVLSVTFQNRLDLADGDSRRPEHIHLGLRRYLGGFVLEAQDTTWDGARKAWPHGLDVRRSSS